MTWRLAPAERNAAAAITLSAAMIAVLSPTARIAGAALVLLLPVCASMMASATAWVGMFLGAVLLLPPLPAAIGNSGVHPSLLLAAFGVYAGLLHRQRWTHRSEPIATWLVALAGIMLASVAMALVYSGASIAMGSAARVALFAITPWVFLYTAVGPGAALGDTGFRPARILFACGVASAAFACIDFFYQLPAPTGYSPQFIWLEDKVIRRAQGLFYDAGALGNVCAFFLVMAAACILLRGRPPVNRMLAAIGAAPLAAALVFSYSRAALLNVGAAVLTLLILRRRDVQSLRLTLALPLAAAGIALAAFLIAPGLTQAWGQRLQRTVMLAGSATDMALSGRLSTWQTIASFALQHPAQVLFGVGYKTLAYSDVLGETVIADNTWLSTFVETGIAGVVALIGLNVAVLRTTFLAARSRDKHTAFYGSWAFAFWVGEMAQMFAADLLTWWRILPMVFFVIALAALGTDKAAA